MSDVNTLVDQASKLSDGDRTTFLTEFVAKQNVLWLSGAVKVLEEKLGVKAQAAVAVAAPVAGGGGAAPAAAAEEPTTKTVVLKASGANKLQVIKVVRQLVPGLGLKEAKDLVEKGGQTVKEGVTKEEAEKIKKELEAAGAEVEVK